MVSKAAAGATNITIVTLNSFPILKRLKICEKLNLLILTRQDQSDELNESI